MSTWRLSGTRVSKTRVPRVLHVEILPTQVVKTEPQRLDLQAQNQVFETQDVIKLITFEIGPTIYIVEKLGLVTHFRPNDTMLNVLLSPIALTTEQVAC